VTYREVHRETTERSPSGTLRRLEAHPGFFRRRGVKLLCHRLWAHQPVTRGPERPIVLIVAHRRNGWEAVTRSSCLNDAGVRKANHVQSSA
jgi:hypothetical protein